LSITQATCSRDRSRIRATSSGSSSSRCATNFCRAQGRQRGVRALGLLFRRAHLAGDGAVVRHRLSRQLATATQDGAVLRRGSEASALLEARCAMCGKRRLMRTSDRAALVMQRLLPQQQRPDGRDREVTWRAPGPCDAGERGVFVKSGAAPIPWPPERRYRGAARA
jgi:hypothetical protein